LHHRQQEQKYELLVIADGRIREDLLRELTQSGSKISMDRKSSIMGMPLRVWTEQLSKRFFEIALNMWKANKAIMGLTMRFGKDKAIVLDESTLPEAERTISELPVS
jgi:hypothetical protein